MLLMDETPVSPAFVTIGVLTIVTQMVDMLAVFLFAMLAGQFDTAAIMRMLAAGFPAVFAERVNTAAIAGHRMDHVRLAIRFIAMIAQNIIASGALMLLVLTIFLITMFALGIFTPAIQGRSMSYMLTVFLFAMLADYNLAKALMLYMLTG